jgi:beta-lactamase superfamily II metal-dependent hydrolase
MSIFRIDMLPGREGDCLWIEYGDRVRPHRILIDGGRQRAYETLKARFAALPADQRMFELLVLSHVDADHIEGLLKLVADPDLPVSFKDVWFNGRKHLEKIEDFGAQQGETFTKGIAARGWDWNSAFEGKSVVIPDSGDLPVKLLADGMRMTLLSPTWDKLGKLAPVWTKELKKAGLDGVETEPDVDPSGIESFGPLTIHEVEAAAASDFENDRSAANGSSICVLAEFDGRKAVLTGDAHADVVAASLARLRKDGNPIGLDAFKLSHHGSRGTHSVQVMQQISCKRFLISTDGSRHKHPHVESMARTVKHSGGDTELVFNYDSEETAQWNAKQLKTRYGFETRYPSADHAGLISTDLT